MIAAIAEALTFNPTHVVFTLYVEHWIFGWTSSPHNNALWKYLSKHYFVHWSYRKVYLYYIGQSRFCNQAFFGTTETLTRPFLNNTSCRHRSSGRYLEYKISNDVFVCVYFGAIINSQQRKKDSNMFNRSFISWQKLDSCHLSRQNTNVTMEKF